MQAKTFQIYMLLQTKQSLSSITRTLNLLSGLDVSNNHVHLAMMELVKPTMEAKNTLVKLGITL